MFVVEDNPKSIIAESYKTLRTNIQYSSYDRKLKAIVVTSSQPGEGKSLTVGNIALSLVQDNKRVLVIDCDLRRPTIHKKFGIMNEKGIAEVIVGSSTIYEVIKRYKKLDIITAGKIPPNPSEMLGSEKMKNIINELKEIYDYILIDSPPVLAVTDAQIISTIVDGVIFVARYGIAKKDKITLAKSQLNKVNANLIGTILHGITKGNKIYDYYDYYGEDVSGNKKKRRGKH